MASALITGITGQDGSYLAELLLEKGYEVHGTVRPSPGAELSRINHLLRNPAIYRRRLFLHEADLTEGAALGRVLKEISPDELYHLAGQTEVGLSFKEPERTCDVVALGTLRLLESIRELSHPPKLFQASSSQVFGHPDAAPQDEQTPFRPSNPYGCAKAFATQMTSSYREHYRLFASNGILYNHESPRRGETFVVQKICLAAAAIKEGRRQELRLGSLTARRDWGDARDYVRGMWLALQHPEPQDFVFATGKLHSVEEVLEIAFGVVGLDWKRFVKEDLELKRPDESTPLVGYAAKAAQLLGWRPTRDFKSLIIEMTTAALVVEGGASLR